MHFNISIPESIAETLIKNVVKKYLKNNSCRTLFNTRKQDDTVAVTISKRFRNAHVSDSNN